MGDQEKCLTAAEAEKVRRIVLDVCGDEYLAAVEAMALRSAIAGGFSERGYAEKRAQAPVIIDLLFALDPAFMVGVTN
ncbi:hypothetical protein [Sphingobium sp.]|uniref:hypothetical protein n=1 Tax=Sphingobium sp. TaxID=1912891 RepID=UPI002D001460|nr:hypothetical protein [Sphingobium sp.]HUD90590.1 hypothetical protein [Sphingobium sp.]